MVKFFRLRSRSTGSYSIKLDGGTSCGFVITAKVCLYSTLIRKILKCLVILAANNKLKCRVTRFGEISSLWQSLKSFGNLLRAYLVFGIHLNLIWQILYTIGQFFIRVNGQVLKIILASGHTVKKVCRICPTSMASKYPNDFPRSNIKERGVNVHY